jgi:hypothetical protein
MSVTEKGKPVFRSLGSLHYYPYLDMGCVCLRVLKQEALWLNKANCICVAAVEYAIWMRCRE